MKKVYESTGNIHIPELKCSAHKGTRMIVDGDSFTMNGLTVPLPQDFQILLKYNLVHELSEKEIELPEKIEEPAVSRSTERQKMKVEIAEDNKVQIKSTKPEKKEMADEDENEEKSSQNTIRGMSVITDESIPIQKTLIKKTEDDDHDSAIVGKIQARPTPKPKKSNISDEEKKAAAEKLKSERVMKSKKSK